MLRDAEGDSAHLLRPKSDAMPKAAEAGERYQLAGEIARGGMGAVLRGRDVELGRELAIKVLLEKYVDRPEVARRFIEEAQIGGQLQHPGVVPVYDIGSFGERPFFTMKLVKGRTLASILGDRAEPAEDRPRLLAIALQVAQTLAYAHAKGVIHRDLKPANIMVGAFGEVQVMDWGLAKVLAEGGIADEERASRAHHPPEVEPTVIRTARSGSAGVGSDTEAGSMLGTPAYMPPEQANGDVANLDRRADVFGLGAILCEILTGKPPYIGRSGEEVRRKAANGDLADAHARLGACEADAELIALTTGCLSPEGIDRPKDAQAVASALTAYLDGVQGRLRRAELEKAAAEARAAEEENTRRMAEARAAEERRRRRAEAGLAAALVAVAVLALVHAGRQAEANRRITQLAGDLEKESGGLKGERGRLQAALSESISRLARLDLERGLAAFDKGEIGLGMVWTLESLKMATEAGDAAARQVALDNLAAWRRSLVEVKEIFSHAAELACVAFSPDGRTIATGDFVNTARLWDVATGRPIGRPILHRDPVRSVAFSPDGRKLATASLDKTARLWDAATGEPLGPVLEHPHRVCSVAFSPDGRSVVTGCVDSAARLWDVATGRPFGPPMHHNSLINSVAFSPDGKMILTGSWDGTARRWDAATGQPLGQPSVHSAEIYGMAFSADGRIFATAGTDGTARLWDAATGGPIGQPFVHSSRVYCVAFSPDGETLLTGGDGKVQSWDVATGQTTGRILEHQAPVWGVAFSPDGRSILTACDDSLARLWIHTAGQPIGRLFDHETARSGENTGGVAFSPGGEMFTIMDYYGTIRRRDLESGRLVGPARSLKGDFHNWALSPDGRTIATDEGRDHTARTWDAATGRPLAEPIAHSARVTAVAFSPDGKRIFDGAFDGTARLWDASDGRPLGPPIRHSMPIWKVAFSPDGKTVLTGGRDNMARLWDAETGRSLGPPLAHASNIRAAAFSHDGRTIATGTMGHTVRLWDVATGRPLGAPLEHPGWITSVAFSPDGRRLLAGWAGGAARLWDVATGQPIGPSLAPTSRGRRVGLTDVAIAPDGTFLLTSSEGTTRRWALPPALPDDLPRLSAWVAVATGLELDGRGAARRLDRDEWLERRRRLTQLGGPPPADPIEMGDPILFGDAPTARGDAWKGRGDWDRAEAAYAEAIRARPLNPSIRLALARCQVERDDRGAAAATLSRAVALMPDNFDLLDPLSVTRLWSGDRSGYRAAVAAMRDRVSEDSAPELVHMVAWRSVLGPDATADLEQPVRLAEQAAREASHAMSRGDSLITLGAASTAPAGSTRRSIGSRKPSGSRVERPVPRIRRSWRWPIVAWGTLRRPGAGSNGCATMSRAWTRPSSGTSWRSVCCATRPRRWSCTIQCSRATRSLADRPDVLRGSSAEP